MSQIDYESGKIDPYQLKDIAEEIGDSIVDENGCFEALAHQEGTLESVYVEILSMLDIAAGRCVFPEDVPVILECLDTKEGKAEAVAKKWEEYW